MSQNGSSPGAPAGQTRYVWYKDLTRYHWFVLSVAIMGWMFDTMAQQLFNLARKPAIRELLGGRASDATVSEQAGYATMVFMIGWALGGVLFGILGDRLGRAKTMIMTILCYSIFTGLSVLSTGVWDFNLYRFLCGLGVGGQFAVGVALVAEVVPERARPHALGMVQAFSAVGNMMAALVGILLGQIGDVRRHRGSVALGISRRRAAGAAGAAGLQEVERTRTVAQGPRRQETHGVGRRAFLRTRAGAAMRLSASCWPSPAWWACGASRFFSYDLLRPVLEQTFRAQGLTGAELAGKTTTWIGITSLLQNLGGFLGVYAFTWLTQRTGRKPAFAVSFLAAMGMTAYTFWNLKNISDIFWMIPLMGFAQLALFGGYAIYLPELFPTRLRSTGTSFCYNVGRLAAAAGPLTLGLLTSRVFAGLRRTHALRRRHHVPGVPGRPGGAALRARDQGPAAAGVAKRGLPLIPPFGIGWLYPVCGASPDPLPEPAPRCAWSSAPTLLHCQSAWLPTGQRASISARWPASARCASACNGSRARSSGSMRPTCSFAACPRPRFSNRSAPPGSWNVSAPWDGMPPSTAPAT